MSQNVNLSALEMYDDWLAHPVTVALNRYLKSKHQEFLVAWAEGRFTSETADATLQLNSNAIGRAGMLLEILELEPSDFLTEQ